MCSDRKRVCGEKEVECVQNDRNEFMSRDRERVCREIENVCE